MSAEPRSRSRAVRLLQVASAVTFCLLTAGVIFGFAALKNVLVREGVYESFCDSERDKQAAHETGRACVGQDLQLNLAFTISVVVTNVGALPVGIILDTIGPQKTSLIGATLFAIGCVVMGLDHTSPKFDPFLISYILLAIGGPMIFLSSFHLCNAFPKRSGLILSSIIGAFDASSLPFVVYSTIYRKHPTSLRKWFWLYNIIPVLIFVQQLVLAPREAYVRSPAEKDEDPSEETALLADSDAANDSSSRPPLLGSDRRPSHYDSSFSRIYGTVDAYDSTHKGSAAPAGQVEQGNADPITGKLWGRSALSQIGTLWFWIPQLFLIVHMLRINYYIATVSDQVYFYTRDEALSQKLTDAFVLLLPFSGIIGIPFIGYILDARSSFTAFAVLLILGSAYGILTLLPNVPSQLIGITAFTLMRPLMYTAISDYYTKVIGIETFGTVYGTANSVSGLFTLVQYPIDYAVKKKLHGNYTPANIVMLVLGSGLAVGVMLKQYYGTKSEQSTGRIDE